MLSLDELQNIVYSALDRLSQAASKEPRDMEDFEAAREVYIDAYAKLYAARKAMLPTWSHLDREFIENMAIDELHRRLAKFKKVNRRESWVPVIENESGTVFLRQIPYRNLDPVAEQEVGLFLLQGYSPQSVPMDELQEILSTGEIALKREWRPEDRVAAVLCRDKSMQNAVDGLSWSLLKSAIEKCRGSLETSLFAILFREDEPIAFMKAVVLDRHLAVLSRPRMRAGGLWYHDELDMAMLMIHHLLDIFRQTPGMDAVVLQQPDGPLAEAAARLGFDTVEDEKGGAAEMIYRIAPYVDLSELERELDNAVLDDEEVLQQDMALSQFLTVVEKEGFTTRDRRWWIQGAPIGRGESSTVFKATDINTGDVAAVKVFTDQQKYIKEVETTDALHCDTKFVCMQDHFEIEIGPYNLFAIVYTLANTDLQQYLRLARLTSEQRETFLSDLYHALHRLEQHALVHNDIQVSNILLYDTDAGLSLALGGLGSACSFLIVNPYVDVESCLAQNIQDAQTLERIVSDMQNVAKVALRILAAPGDALTPDQNELKKLVLQVVKSTTPREIVYLTDRIMEQLLSMQVPGTVMDALGSLVQVQQ